MRLERPRCGAPDAIDTRRHQWGYLASRRPTARSWLAERILARRSTLSRRRRHCRGITALRLEALPDAVVAQRRPGPRRLRQLPGERHSDSGRSDDVLASKVRTVKADDSAGGSGTFNASSPRSRRATGRRREAGASTPAATKAACPGKSCSRSTIHSTRRSGQPANPPDASGIGRRAGAGPIPAVGSARPTPERIVEIPAKLRPILDIAARRSDEEAEGGSRYLYRALPHRSNRREIGSQR